MERVGGERAWALEEDSYLDPGRHRMRQVVRLAQCPPLGTALFDISLGVL